MAQNPGSSEQATAGAQMPQVDGGLPKVLNIEQTTMENVEDCKSLIEKYYDGIFADFPVTFETTPAAILIDPTNPTERKIPVVLMAQSILKAEGSKEPDYTMSRERIRHGIEKLATLGTKFCFHANLENIKIIVRFVKIEDWDRMEKMVNYNLKHLENPISPPLKQNNRGYIRPAHYSTERPITG